MTGSHLHRAMKKTCRLLAPAVIVLAAMLAACTHQSGGPVATPAAARTAGLDLAAYRLGPGDKLKITIFGHPQESGTFEVDGLGYIAYPLLGRVEAKERTVAQLTEYLQVELNKTFIVDPRVPIEVLNYRPFYIYGEVNRSGSYPYVSGLTIRRAVAIAGGFTRRAREAPVTLVREDAKGVMKYDAQLEAPVLPGDVIEVERRLF
jgi:polysaccharide export outer membrane protein